MIMATDPERHTRLQPHRPMRKPPVYAAVVFIVFASIGSVTAVAWFLSEFC